MIWWVFFKDVKKIFSVLILPLFVSSNSRGQKSTSLLQFVHFWPWKWLILTLNTRGSKWDLKNYISKWNDGRHIIMNLNNENLFEANRTIFGQFFVIFLIFQGTSIKFWHKFHTWLQSSGNEDSYATLPKFLGCTSKCPDFCDRLIS